MLSLEKIIERNNKIYKSYPINITFNGLKIDELIISPHLDKRNISHEEIYQLVLQLNNQEDILGFRNEKVIDKFIYFVKDPIYSINIIKAYRLVWWLEDDCNYIGVRTCFRNRKHDVR